MTHPPAAQNFREQQAGSLQTGDQLLLPDGERSAEIHSVEVENDDFGTAAIILATLTGGGMLRIAAGSSVRIAGPTPASGQPRPDGSAPAVSGQTGAPESRAGKGAGEPGSPAESDAAAPLRVDENPAAGRLCPRRRPPSSYLPCLPQRPR